LARRGELLDHTPELNRCRCRFYLYLQGLVGATGARNGELLEATVDIPALNAINGRNTAQLRVGIFKIHHIGVLETVSLHRSFEVNAGAYGQNIH
jgi:hypothetical protein